MVGAFLEAIAWRDIALVVALGMGLAMWGLVRGWWVTGKRYEEMEKDRNYFRDRFFDLLGPAKVAADIALEEITP